MVFTKKITHKAIITLTLTLNLCIFAIHGSNLKPHEVPEAIKSSSVSLLKEFSGKKIKHVCSGTIIEKDTILTAAHCFDDKNFNIIVLHDRKMLIPKSIRVNSQYSQTKLFDEMEYHYDTVIRGDYALIKMNYHFPKDNVAKLPKYQSAYKEGDEIYFSGSGINVSDPFGSESRGEGILRVSQATYAQPNFVTSQRMRIENYNTGTCLGDSGGTAWIKNNNQWIQFGIISQGDCYSFSAVERVTMMKLKLSTYKTYYPNK